MSPPRILHIIPTKSRPYLNMIRGIFSYAREHTDWVIPQTWYYIWSERDEQFRKLKGQRYDGCIAFIDDQIMLDMLESMNIPVVDVLWKLKEHRFPICTEHYYQSGQLAANYLLERGYYNLILRAGSSTSHANSLVTAGFTETATAHQATLHVRNPDDKLHSELAQVKQILQKLPPATAAFLMMQRYVLKTYHTARDLGHRIPEDLALLGYGQTGLYEESLMGISALKRPMYSIGYQAANILHRILEGECAPAQPTLIPPEGIHEDQSTNALSIEDPELKDAVQFINDHFKEAITIDDLAEDSNLSRRTLERRFKSRLKVSPQKLLEKKRMAYIRELLIHSDMSISLISTHAGYNNPVHMTHMFKRHTLITPREYRSRYRSH